MSQGQVFYWLADNLHVWSSAAVVLLYGVIDGALRLVVMLGEDR